MKHPTALVITVVFLSCMLEVYPVGVPVQGKACDANILEECHYLQSCVIISRNLNGSTQHLQGVCSCLPGYLSDENGNCVSEEAAKHLSSLGHKSASASSVAAGVVIPLTVIAGVGALIYFGRRHQWWHKLRRVPIRQYDTVLIGSQMDVDDDPPIS